MAHWQAQNVPTRASDQHGSPADYARGVSRSVLQRIHNPRNRECGCDGDCWCRRTALGRAVKWWFPARLVGLHHKNDQLAAWKQSRDQSA